MEVGGYVSGADRAEREAARLFRADECGGPAGIGYVRGGCFPQGQGAQGRGGSSGDGGGTGAGATERARPTLTLLEGNEAGRSLTELLQARPIGATADS
jgi:hypothetical protein